jgi:hypothetical protein
MGEVGLVSALIGARTVQLQMAVAAKMLKMNADAAQSEAQVIDAAQQNVDRLATVAAGVGQNVDISV